MFPELITKCFRSSNSLQPAFTVKKVQGVPLNLALALIVQLIACQSSRADVAPEPISGGITIGICSGNPITSVMLESEEVRLDLYPDNCETSAKFVLHNTGRDCNLEVGFPDEAGEGGTILQDFHAFVEGQPVTVTRKFVEKTDWAKRQRSYPWLVWNMNFKAGQTSHVEVAYHNRPRKNFSMSIKGSGISTVLGEHNAFVRDCKLRTVRYILDTGSYWFGVIKTCDITAKFHEPLQTKNVVSTHPLPTGPTTSELTWHLTNLYEKGGERRDGGFGEVEIQYSANKTRQEFKTYLSQFCKANPKQEYFADYIKRLNGDLYLSP